MKLPPFVFVRNGLGAARAARDPSLFPRARPPFHTWHRYNDLCFSGGRRTEPSGRAIAEQTLGARPRPFKPELGAPGRCKHMLCGSESTTSRRLKRFHLEWNVLPGILKCQLP